MIVKDVENVCLIHDRHKVYYKQSMTYRMVLLSVVGLHFGRT